MRIQSNLIRGGRKNRPGSRPVRRILICETGNRCSCANALAYAAYLDSEAAELARESWHYTVDDRHVVQHLPDGESCFLPRKIRDEVVIKLCVNEGGDFQQTLWNAAALVRELLRVHGLGAHSVHLKSETGVLMTQELWRQFLKQSCASEGPCYSQKGEIYQIELSPARFGILIWKKEKSTTAVANYANCGFFVERAGGELVPRGNLVIDGVVHASGGKGRCTTFWMDRMGRTGISRFGTVRQAHQLRWAVSGAPVFYRGEQCLPSVDLRAEGWSRLEFVPGWHGFLGVKEGRAYYFALRVERAGTAAFDEMVRKLAPYGMEDIIKLDGGSSFVCDIAGQKIGGGGEKQKVHNLLLF